MKQRYIFKIFLLSSLLIFAATSASFAAKFKTIEGTIQGASCVIHKHTCPLNASDPHIALEREFVLLADNGKYYYLPNISRSIKTKYLNHKVKISGDLKEHSFIVSNIDAKIGGKYTTVWNWEQIVKSMNQGQ